MATTTFPAAVAMPQRSLARTVAVYAKESKYELLKNTRIPVYAISTVAFPLMFYVLFGIVLGHNNPAARDNGTYMLATMGCFGVMAVALFGFGVSLAMERGQGWLQVKRASPMPVSAYFFAKLFAAVVFSTVIILLLLTVGYAFGGVRLPIATAAKLLGTLVPIVHAAARIADLREAAAGLSHEPVGTERRRHGHESDPGLGTCGSAAGIHHDLP